MNHPLKHILILCLLFVFSSAAGQYGLRIKYNKNTFSDWDKYIKTQVNGDTPEIFTSNLELGIDYWFRLKNHRIEFMPEVLMGLKASTEYPNASKTDLQYFGFNFNTQVYIFDLEGDCDCPTFSKQGPSLQKGFFLNLAPGIVYNNKDLSKPDIETFSTSHINFRIGLGAGFDIGINDFFTISPSINYNIAPNVIWNDLSGIQGSIQDTEVIKSNWNQIQFQLRLGFRPDYVKSYGRRR